MLREVSHALNVKSTTCWALMMMTMTMMTVIDEMMMCVCSFLIALCCQIIT